MDREAIIQLARLYGSPATDTHGNVTIRCPLASKAHRSGRDDHPSFSVKVTTDERSVAHCFACGFAGPVRRAFEEAHETLGTFAEALHHIDATDKGGLEAALAGLRRQRREDPLTDPMATVAPSDIERYVARCTRLVPKYLIERGIVRADVEKWRLGFDPDTMRAVFPVWDETGRLVGTDRRTVLPDAPGLAKYHAWPPGFPKRNYFYGENHLDTTRERVYLVEGPMDAIFAGRVLPNVLALMGAHTGIGPERYAKLRRWARRVTFIFDGDDAGDEAVNGWIDDSAKYHPGLREKLRSDFVVEVAALPQDADPASVPPDVLLEAVRTARYL